MNPAPPVTIHVSLPPVIAGACYQTRFSARIADVETAAAGREDHPRRARAETEAGLVALHVLDVDVVAEVDVDAAAAGLRIDVHRGVVRHEQIDAAAPGVDLERSRAHARHLERDAAAPGVDV